MSGTIQTPDLADQLLRCARCNAPSAAHYAYCPQCGLETQYIARRLKTVRDASPYGQLTDQQLDDAIKRGAKGLQAIKTARDTA